MTDIDRLVAWLLLATLLLALSASAEPFPVRVSNTNTTRAAPSLAERARNKPNYEAHPADELVCRPFGECEPCPEDDVSDHYQEVERSLERV